MSPNAYAFLVLLNLSLAIAFVLFFSLRDALCGLLQRTVRLPDGVTFYARSFAVLVFFSTLGGAVATSFDLKPESHFMEYVWKVASGLSEVLGKTLLFLAFYLVLITVLIATLKIKDDK